MNIYLTGAEGNLGKQWAKSLARAGALVHPLDIHSPTPCDITDAESIRRVYELYQESQRGSAGVGGYAPASPDGLICAAAIDYPPGTPGGVAFEEMPLDLWEQILKVNLTGVMLPCQIIGAEMAKAGHGSIILVSSMYGLIAPDNRRYADLVAPPFYKPAAYGATKAAIQNLAKYLACHWGPAGVRVNAVSFGVMESEQHQPPWKQRMEKAIPLGRIAKTGEWDGIIQFLLSDESSYITGATIVVDGGMTAW